MGGTGRPLGKTFFLHRQRRHPELPKIPTYLPVHSPTPGQLHVESIQLACTCALCCCYALCMKREELCIFYSLWVRCFVVMLQYVGFLGRSQLFGSQVRVGAPTWHLARQVRFWRAPSPVLARASYCPILPVCLHPVPLTPFMHSLCLLGISPLYSSDACKATQEGQGEEGDSRR